MTAEWNGEWSDKSGNWSQKAMNKIGYKPADEIDGIFWMSVEDFVWEFKYLYVCRTLSEA